MRLSSHLRTLALLLLAAATTLFAPTPTASSTLIRTIPTPTPRASSSSTAIFTRAPASTAAPRCAWTISRPAACCNPRPSRQQYFAEGLASWGSTLVQLTWQSHVAFVYDRFSFRLLRTFHYDCDGWGLTADSKNLILSDGTARIRFFDPATFREVRRIEVKDHGQPVTQLNELEYIHGQIYSNVWHTDRIARISPVTGQVLGWINLAGLLAPGEVSDPEAVLNGIAYDAMHDRLFVTGKLWPKLFEIKIIPAKPKTVPVHRAK